MRKIYVSRVSKVKADKKKNCRHSGWYLNSQPGCGKSNVTGRAKNIIREVNAIISGKKTDYRRQKYFFLPDNIL